MEHFWSLKLKEKRRKWELGFFCEMKRGGRGLAGFGCGGEEMSGLGYF